MPWVAARLLPRREGLALHCLALAGYSTYLPRCRERRLVRGRRIEVTPPLFPGYCFVVIEQQWHRARWAPGVASIIMDGDAPAKVPDAVIDEIRSRERNGVVELPQRRCKCSSSVQVAGTHADAGSVGCPTCSSPKQQGLDWHPITVEFMIFVVAALAGAKVGEVMNELDCRDPFHHLESQLVLAA